jgi:hypothetical protein
MLLENVFVIDIDYKILPNLEVKQTLQPRGGHMSNAWSHVKGMVTCQTHGGHMSNAWSHVKRMVVTCQRHGGHMSSAWSRDRRKW